MTYVIGSACVDLKDRTCVDQCPVDCIYEGQRALYIHPGECVDCGACEPVCPVEAICHEEDLPSDEQQALAINSEFFAGLGSPGGACTVGALRDHPLVAAMPSRDGGPDGAAGDRQRPG